MKPPLYFVAIPFALGIVAQREFSWVVFGVIAIFMAMNWAKRYPVISFVAAGFLMAAITEHRNEIPYDTSIEIVSRVESPATLSQNGKWNRTTSRVLSYKDSTGAWHGVDQKVQTYIDTAVSVGLGNTLHFSAKQYPLDSTFAKYYMNRGVTGRVFARNVSVLESDTTLLEHISLASSNLSAKIEKISTSQENIGLMQALTLGDKSNLSREQRSENNLAGTAHILAVSGLHVGIIFMILGFLLGWLKLLKRGRVIFGITVIVLLWIYAAITGFSPSVLRAVVMFSMYQLGTIFSRSSNNLNTLLGAGLVLLMCNPNYMYDIGFQLSFSAMFGIVMFYQPIYAVWRNRLWGLVAISLAAQIAVAPLACYYFGTIPLFGILTNLALWIVVPAIIVLTFAYLFTGVMFVGTTSAWVASIYNNFVSWSASYDWIAVRGVEMPQWVCILIYVVMIAGVRVFLMTDKVGKFR